MDPILPMGTVFKLVFGLGLCFGGLMAAAWLMKRWLPGLSSKFGPSAKDETAGLKVESRMALGPGSSLLLVQAAGRRLLLLQSKDSAQVVWEGDAVDAAEDEAAVPSQDLFARLMGLAPAPGPRGEALPAAAAPAPAAPSLQDGAQQRGAGELDKLGRPKIRRADQPRAAHGRFGSKKPVFEPIAFPQAAPDTAHSIEAL